MFLLSVCVLTLTCCCVNKWDKVRRHYRGLRESGLQLLGPQLSCMCAPIKDTPKEDKRPPNKGQAESTLACIHTLSMHRLQLSLNLRDGP